MLNGDLDIDVSVMKVYLRFTSNHISNLKTLDSEIF